MVDEMSLPLTKSQRGSLLLCAMVTYLVMFSVAGISMAIANTTEAALAIKEFVNDPLLLFGGLLTLGFIFFYKDKAAEKTETIQAASRERIALSATPLEGYQVATLEPEKRYGYNSASPIVPEPGNTETKT